MPKKLESFTVEDGKDVYKVALMQIDSGVGKKALAEYNRAFSAAVGSGALLRAALQNTMREQNIWNDKKEKQYTSIIERINSNSDKIARGGIKLSEAKKLALDSQAARQELRELIAERTSLDTNTAEGQAENARFNFIVSEITVDDDTGEKFFKDLDDYLSRSATALAVEAAQRLANVMYGLDPSYEKNLPENKFLKKWGFVNDDLRLVNKDGHLVDVDGRLVDENGRFIDEDGNFVDIDGNLITEDGELDVEAQPFLDDEGEPLEDPDKTEPEKAQETQET